MRLCEGDAGQLQGWRLMTRRAGQAGVERGQRQETKAALASGRPLRAPTSYRCLTSFTNLLHSAQPLPPSINLLPDYN